MMLRTSGTLAIAGCLSFACSLINKPDEVLPVDPAAGGTTGSGGDGAGGSAGEQTTAGGTESSGGTGVGGSVGGSGGDGGVGGAGSGGASTTATTAGGMGGDGAGGSAGEDGSSGGTSSTTASTSGGGSGGTGVTPPSIGLVTVAGVDSDSGRSVLSVLSAEDGELLAQEDLQVGGIAYDGAPGKDTWFIFTSADFPPDPAIPVNLEVRRFDDESNEWTTISQLTAIPPPRPDQFTVLNNRLVYLSYRLENNVPVEALTILNTTDLEDIRVIDNNYVPTGAMIGITGARGAPNDAEALGGIVDVMLAEDCTAVGGLERCSLVAQPIFLGNQQTVGVPVDISALAGNFMVGPSAYYTARLQEETHIALPDDEGRVYIAVADPRDPADLTDFDPTAGTAIGGLAISECNRVAAFTKVSEGQLYAFNLDGALGNSVDLGHEGQKVAYESFEEQIIVSYKPTGSGQDPLGVPYIRAFTTGRNGVGVSIAERTEFAAPATLIPDTLATRIVLPIDCPE